MRLGSSVSKKHVVQTSSDLEGTGAALGQDVQRPLSLGVRDAGCSGEAECVCICRMRQGSGWMSLMGSWY